MPPTFRKESELKLSFAQSLSAVTLHSPSTLTVLLLVTAWRADGAMDSSESALFHFGLPFVEPQYATRKTTTNLMTGTRATIQARMCNYLFNFGQKHKVTKITLKLTQHGNSQIPLLLLLLEKYHPFFCNYQNTPATVTIYGRPDYRSLFLTLVTSLTMAMAHPGYLTLPSRVLVRKVFIRCIMMGPLCT